MGAGPPGATGSQTRPSGSGSGGSTISLGGGSFSTYMSPISFQGRVPSGVLPAGVNYFTIGNTASGDMRMALTVVELKR